MPDLLVLETDAWFRLLDHTAAFYESQYDSCHNDHFVFDVAAEVVELLRERHRAEYQLRGWCAEIQAGLGYAGADILPPPLAPLILDFGLDVLRQLLEAGAYLPNGVLPYHFHMLHDHTRQSTTYLARTAELPR